MPFTIIRQDITKMEVDAIVNAANTDLRMGGGVCGAIFKAAGATKLQKACNAIAPIKVGGAAITPGFKLPAKYVIHAAGPVYQQWDKEQSKAYLRSAYLESLKIAESKKVKSIAFPLISSGIYGYPKEEAINIATTAIRDFLSDHEMDIYLVVFDRTSFVVSKEVMENVASYIDEHYVHTHDVGRSQLLNVESKNQEMAVWKDTPVFASKAMRKTRLDEMMEKLDEPFSDTLFKLIDQKGKSDVEVYKKANIDRKLFSKIRSVKGYTPKKTTILALAIALELTLPETDELLERAGYALSHASKFDIIIEYFIINQRYKIYDINEVLFEYDQPLLGA